jgi:hypothetical protein
MLLWLAERVLRSIAVREEGLEPTARQERAREAVAAAARLAEATATVLELVGDGAQSAALAEAAARRSALHAVLERLRALYSPDLDLDDVPDLADNCPELANPEQEDSDADGRGDACASPPFRRGDANSSGALDLSDAVFTFSFLFLGGTTPRCAAAADANADLRVDVSDGVYTLNFLFGRGAPPPSPGPFFCGIADGTESVGPCAYPLERCR